MPQVIIPIHTFCRLSAVLLAVSAFVSHARADTDAAAWRLTGETAIKDRLAQRPIERRAKNIILMIGDGNGVATNYATRVFQGQAQGKLGEEHELAYETMPYLALAKTYNTNAQTPDSAGTATAIMTGVKTRAGVLNVDARVARGACGAGAAARLIPISELAHARGRAVGVVSTTRITHATPASVFSYAADRNYEDDSKLPDGCATPDIARQLVEAMKSGKVDIAMGGGLRHFLPRDGDGAGRRADGRDLLEELRAVQVQIATDGAAFAGLKNGAPMLGLFNVSHMQFEHDRAAKARDEPTLADMTRRAITALADNEKGYFLMVEGGRIDHANHAGNLHRAVNDGIAFADAAKVAMEMTDPRDTLIIVTADHGHTLTFNGYCGRGTPITGLCYKIDEAGEKHLPAHNLGDDGLPYTAALYANGAHAVVAKKGNSFLGLLNTGLFGGGRDAALDAEKAGHPDYHQQALVPLPYETHSGVDVAVYARGPSAHLVSGTMEQHVLYYIMRHALTGE